MEFGQHMCFLITSLYHHLVLPLQQELTKHGVHDVVRVCEPTYKIDELKKAGISVMDLVFDDGTFPPAEVRLASSFL